MITNVQTYMLSEEELGQDIGTKTQKQYLIDQNIKLKTQIFELSKELDEIIARDKQRKKNYGSIRQDDETMK